jgi:hypothetical protein
VGFIAVVVIAALSTAGITRLRARWLVALGSLFTALASVAWAILTWIAATPCALSGSGFLTPTSDCPVQATHVVSAAIFCLSIPALLVGSGAGLVYAADRNASAGRIFRIALLIAAALMLIWLVADIALPRVAPSD